MVHLNIKSSTRGTKSSISARRDKRFPPRPPRAGAFVTQPQAFRRLPSEGRPLTRFPAPQGHHVVRRTKNALDLRCEGLESFALFPAERVPVIDAPHRLAPALARPWRTKRGNRLPAAQQTKSATAQPPCAPSRRLAISQWRRFFGTVFPKN
jgi:hypothetical protein